MMLATVQCFRWDDQIIPQAISVWPILCINMVIAFSLNVLVTTFLKISTGISFIVTGVAKDIIIVTLSAIIFSDPLATQQIVCFSCSMCFICFHSAMKLYPDEFNKGYGHGVK